MTDLETLHPAGTVLDPADLALWCSAQKAHDAARAEAARIIERAHAAREDERQRGYAEGLERARVDMAHHILATAEAGERVLVDIEAALPGIVADVIEDMLGRVDLDEVLPIAIRHGLGRVRRGSTAKLRIAADCAHSLTDVMAELQAAGSPVTIDIDPMLAPGRCVLESEFGSAELGLAAQLRVLRERLHDRWQTAASPES